MLHAISHPAGPAADSAPARAARVVHCSFGRLRVHLPHWTGERGEEMVAAVRRLAGVSHAEANPITGNLLVLFAPRQTNVPTLLAALAALRLEPWAALEPTVVPVRILPPPAPAETTYLTGATGVAYQALGWTSVGLAVVGAVTPGIPTVPFVLLAGYFFIRSSPRAHQWLRQSRWFGPIMRDWEEHRAVRRSVRNAGAGLIVLGAGVTVLLGLPPVLSATILTLELIGLAIVLNLRVVEPAALAAPARP